MQARWWVWIALAGVAISGTVLAVAFRKIVATFPQEAREAVRDAVRKRPRVVAVAGVVAAWTLVYALYSMSLPANVTARSSDQSLGSAAPRLVDDEISTKSGLSSPSGDAVSGPVAIGSGEGLPPIDVGPAPGGGGPTQAPCAVEDQADQVRETQAAAEALLGRPIGTDLSILIESLAGCGDPASAALALLGPVDQLISDLGIVPDTIPLPELPDADLPTVPEQIAGPLRPYVFDACAQASSQLVTVGALAPFFHLDYQQVVETLAIVDKICGTFAPA